MIKGIVGIPADGPDLSDPISQHFGHSNFFVGVEITDHTFKKAFSIQNEGHTGCMEPVMKMKENNVTDMILGGIGGRPFMGFLQMGITLYQAIPGSVEENILHLIKGELKNMGGPSCGGGSEHEHASCE